MLQEIGTARDLPTPVPRSAGRVRQRDQDRRAGRVVHAVHRGQFQPAASATTRHSHPASWRSPAPCEPPTRDRHRSSRGPWRSPCSRTRAATQRVSTTSIAELPGQRHPRGFLRLDEVPLEHLEPRGLTEAAPRAVGDALGHARPRRRAERDRRGEARWDSPSAPGRWCGPEMPSPSSIQGIGLPGKRSGWPEPRSCRVPVDGHGLDVGALRRLAVERPIRAVYVTPHHQFPTTATLTAARRLSSFCSSPRRQALRLSRTTTTTSFTTSGRPVLPLELGQGWQGHLRRDAL